MATYIVKNERLTVGELLNRKVVEEALLEGRVIPPVVEYHEYRAGDEVELDKDRAESLVKSGAVEPTSGGLDSLKKGELEDLADEHGVDLSDASNNEERVAALRDAGVSSADQE